MEKNTNTPAPYVPALFFGKDKDEVPLTGVNKFFNNLISRIIQQGHHPLLSNINKTRFKQELYSFQLEKEQFVKDFTDNQKQMYGKIKFSSNIFEDLKATFTVKQAITAINKHIASSGEETFVDDVGGEKVKNTITLLSSIIPQVVGYVPINKGIVFVIAGTLAISYLILLAKNSFLSCAHVLSSLKRYLSITALSVGDSAKRFMKIPETILKTTNRIQKRVLEEHKNMIRMIASGSTFKLIKNCIISFWDQDCSIGSSSPKHFISASYIYNNLNDIWKFEPTMPSIKAIKLTDDTRVHGRLINVSLNKVLRRKKNYPSIISNNIFLSNKSGSLNEDWVLQFESSPSGSLVCNIMLPSLNDSIHYYEFGIREKLQLAGTTKRTTMFEVRLME